ncbi:MAG: sortase [Chloroflexi bacterium]|nr:sortase [Chloroflexota bacterium]
MFGDVVLWVTMGGVVGGVITPFVFLRKGHDPLQGALIGILAGAIGNLFFLVPLWLAWPRVNTRAYSFSSMGTDYQPLPLRSERRLPARQTCFMLFLEVALLLAGSYLLITNLAPSSNLVSAVTSFNPLTLLPADDKSEPGDEPLAQATPQRAAPAGLTRDDVLPTFTPQPLVPTRLISFPGADMSAPIVEAGRIQGTWETRHLGDSVGHLSGTSELFQRGNIVLAGHVESHTGAPGPFKHLFEAEAGDIVILSQGDREEYFEVTEITIVDPYDISYVSQSGPHRLTLITCTDWNYSTETYDGRLVVVAYPTTPGEASDQLVKE